MSFSFEPSPIPLGDIPGVHKTVLARDVDRDGNDDIIVGAGPRISLYLGNGDGTFDAPRVLELSGRVGFLIVGRFDGDQYLDLVSAPPGINPTAFNSVVRVHVFDPELGNFRTRRTTPVAMRVSGLAPANFDDRAKQEIVSTGTGRSEAGIFEARVIGLDHSRGGLRISDHIATLPGQALSRPLWDAENSRVLVGGSSGHVWSFTRSVQGGALFWNGGLLYAGSPFGFVQGVALGDTDGNGTRDLLFDDGGGRIVRVADGGTGAVTTFVPLGGQVVVNEAITTVADFDRDGRADVLVLVHELMVARHKGALNFGHASGGFTSVEVQGPDESPHAGLFNPDASPLSAIADFNNDGLLDWAHGYEGLAVQLGIGVP